jgi:hypothetical protein
LGRPYAAGVMIGNILFESWSGCGVQVLTDRVKMMGQLEDYSPRRERRLHLVERRIIYYRRWRIE